MFTTIVAGTDGSPDAEAEFREIKADPTDAILDVVDWFDGDLIVVGSRVMVWPSVPCPSRQQPDWFRVR